MHNLLKQTAATASATATEDQASDHSAQDKVQRTEFDLEVVEAPPTADQLKTMLEYGGVKKPDALVTGATSITDAVKKLQESGDLFKRPVVCIGVVDCLIGDTLMIPLRLLTGLTAKLVS